MDWKKLSEEVPEDYRYIVIRWINKEGNVVYETKKTHEFTKLDYITHWCYVKEPPLVRLEEKINVLDCRISRLEGSFSALKETNNKE